MYHWIPSSSTYLATAAATGTSAAGVRASRAAALHELVAVAAAARAVALGVGAGSAAAHIDE